MCMIIYTLIYYLNINILHIYAYILLYAYGNMYTYILFNFPNYCVRWVLLCPFYR